MYSSNGRTVEQQLRVGLLHGYQWSYARSHRCIKHLIPALLTIPPIHLIGLHRMLSSHHDNLIRNLYLQSKSASYETKTVIILTYVLTNRKV